MTLDARVGGGGASGHPLLGRVALVATVIVLAGHGLVHLMGVALLWKLGEPANLSYADAVPEPGTTAGYLAGGLWLVASVAFVLAAALMLARRAAWRAVALAGVVISTVVIGLSPGPAVAGLVVNGLVLVLVVVSWLRARAGAR